MSKPTMTREIELRKRIYDRSCVGCCLHIALDDGNWERDHIAFCLGQAKEENHPDCIELAQLLLKMPDKERQAFCEEHEV